MAEDKKPGENQYTGDWYKDVGNVSDERQKDRARFYSKKAQLKLSVDTEVALNAAIKKEKRLVPYSDIKKAANFEEKITDKWLYGALDSFFENNVNVSDEAARKKEVFASLYAVGKKINVDLIRQGSTVEIKGGLLSVKNDDGYQYQNIPLRLANESEDGGVTARGVATKAEDKTGVHTRDRAETVAAKKVGVADKAVTANNNDNDAGGGDDDTRSTAGKPTVTARNGELDAKTKKPHTDGAAMGSHFEKLLAKNVAASEEIKARKEKNKKLAVSQKAIIDPARDVRQADASPQSKGSEQAKTGEQSKQSKKTEDEKKYPKAGRLPDKIVLPFPKAPPRGPNPFDNKEKPTNAVAIEPVVEQTPRTKSQVAPPTPTPLPEPSAPATEPTAPAPQTTLSTEPKTPAQRPIPEQEQPISSAPPKPASEAPMPPTAPAMPLETETTAKPQTSTDEPKKPQTAPTINSAAPTPPPSKTDDKSEAPNKVDEKKAKKTPSEKNDEKKKDEEDVKPKIEKLPDILGGIKGAESTLDHGRKQKGPEKNGPEEKEPKTEEINKVETKVAKPEEEKTKNPTVEAANKPDEKIKKPASENIEAKESLDDLIKHFIRLMKAINFEPHDKKATSKLGENPPKYVFKKTDSYIAATVTLAKTNENKFEITADSANEEKIINVTGENPENAVANLDSKLKEILEKAKKRYEIAKSRLLNLVSFDNEVRNPQNDFLRVYGTGKNFDYLETFPRSDMNFHASISDKDNKLVDISTNANGDVDSAFNKFIDKIISSLLGGPVQLGAYMAKQKLEDSEKADDRIEEANAKFRRLGYALDKSSIQKGAMGTLGASFKRNKDPVQIDITTNKQPDGSYEARLSIKYPVSESKKDDTELTNPNNTNEYSHTENDPDYKTLVDKVAAYVESYKQREKSPEENKQLRLEEIGTVLKEEYLRGNAENNDRWTLVEIDEEKTVAIRMKDNNARYEFLIPDESKDGRLETDFSSIKALEKIKAAFDKKRDNETEIFNNLLQKARLEGTKEEVNKSKGLAHEPQNYSITFKREEYFAEGKNETIKVGSIDTNHDSAMTVTGSFDDVDEGTEKQKFNEKSASNKPEAKIAAVIAVVNKIREARDAKIAAANQKIIDEANTEEAKRQEIIKKSEAESEAQKAKFMKEAGAIPVEEMAKIDEEMAHPNTTVDGLKDKLSKTAGVLNKTLDYTKDNKDRLHTIIRIQNDKFDDKKETYDIPILLIPGEGYTVKLTDDTNIPESLQYYSPTPNPEKLVSYIKKTLNDLQGDLNPPFPGAVKVKDAENSETAPINGKESGNIDINKIEKNILEGLNDKQINFSLTKKEGDTYSISAKTLDGHELTNGCSVTFDANGKSGKLFIENPLFNNLQPAPPTKGKNGTMKYRPQEEVTFNSPQDLGNKLKHIVVKPNKEYLEAAELNKIVANGEAEALKWTIQYPQFESSTRLYDAIHKATIDVILIPQLNLEGSKTLKGGFYAIVSKDNNAAEPKLIRAPHMKALIEKVNTYLKSSDVASGNAN